METTPSGGRRCGVGANWLAIFSLATRRLALGLGTGGLKICHLLMTRHVPGTAFWSCASSSKQYLALPKNGSKYYLKYTFLAFPVLGILDLGTSLQITHPTRAAILLHNRPPSCLLAHDLGHDRARRALWRAWHTFVTANHAEAPTPVHSILAPHNCKASKRCILLAASPNPTILHFLFVCFFLVLEFIKCNLGQWGAFLQL